MRECATDGVSCFRVLRGEWRDSIYRPRRRGLNDRQGAVTTTGVGYFGVRRNRATNRYCEWALRARETRCFPRFSWIAVRASTTGARRSVVASNRNKWRRARASRDPARRRIDVALDGIGGSREHVHAAATPMRRKRSLFVTEEERALLLSWLASAALTPGMALRARIVLA